MFSRLSVVVFSLLVTQSAVFNSTAYANEQLTVHLAGQSRDQLVINTPTKLEYSVFKLKNPSRIVIDLFGVESLKEKNWSLSQNPRFKSIRFGMHKSKTRMVIDLRETTIPRYAIQQTATGLQVRFIEKNKPSSITAASLESAPSLSIPAALTTPALIQAARNRKSNEEMMHKKLTEIPSGAKVETHASAAPHSSVLPKQKVAPLEFLIQEKRVAEPLASLSSKTKLPSAPIQEIQKTEPIEPKIAPKLETNQPKHDSSLLSLTAINFEYSSEKAPQIAFDLNAGNTEQGPDYQFVRYSDYYELSIANAALDGDHLALPFFPPYDFEGFVYVLANQNDQHIKMKIGIEPNTQLSAFIDNNRIFVRKKNS